MQLFGLNRWWWCFLCFVCLHFLFSFHDFPSVFIVSHGFCLVFMFFDAFEWMFIFCVYHRTITLGPMFLRFVDHHYFRGSPTINPTMQCLRYIVLVLGQLLPVLQINFFQSIGVWLFSFEYSLIAMPWRLCKGCNSCYCKNYWQLSHIIFVKCFV